MDLLLFLFVCCVRFALYDGTTLQAGHATDMREMTRYSYKDTETAVSDVSRFRLVSSSS